nr:MAG TPA: hypothetical protein [Caudoviricetes sp.]
MGLDPPVRKSPEGLKSLIVWVLDKTGIFAR